MLFPTAQRASQHRDGCCGSGGWQQAPLSPWCDACRMQQGGGGDVLAAHEEPRRGRSSCMFPVWLRGATWWPLPPGHRALHVHAQPSRGICSCAHLWVAGEGSRERVSSSWGDKQSSHQLFAMLRAFSLTPGRRERKPKGLTTQPMCTGTSVAFPPLSSGVWSNAEKCENPRASMISAKGI